MKTNIIRHLSKHDFCDLMIANCWHMKKWIPLLLCVFLLQACTPSNAQIKVACVGNSITFGYKLDEKDAYPEKLKLLLGSTFEVKNFGVTGRTLLRDGEAPYWNEKKYKEALAWNPDIVIIKLGTNDARPQNWDANKGEFYGDYIDFINSFKSLASKPKIYICYPIPVFGTASSAHVVIYEIIPTIKKVALASDVTIIDLHSPFVNKRNLTFDDVHPTPEGTTVIANEVYKAIK